MSKLVIYQLCQNIILNTVIQVIIFKRTNYLQAHTFIFLIGHTDGSRVVWIEFHRQLKWKWLWNTRHEDLPPCCQRLVVADQLLSHDFGLDQMSTFRFGMYRLLWQQNSFLKQRLLFTYLFLSKKEWLIMGCQKTSNCPYQDGYILEIASGHVFV